MKTFEIKTLLLVTAVALLPIACGTTSPTGPDAAGDVSVFALRAEPLPPTVPQVPTADTVPVETQPSDPGVDVAPVPPVAPDNGHRPRPSPTPVPGAPNAGTPDADVQGPIGSDPTPMPADPSDPGGVPEADNCLADSIEITELNVFNPTSGLALEALLFDGKGAAITDDSCTKLKWRVEATQADGNRVSNVTIDSSPDGRNVTLSGPAGVYKVGATAPNGTSASRLVTIQGPPVGAPTTTVTAPTAPAPGTIPCDAISVDISSVPVTQGAASWTFQAILTDSQGRQITDASCDTVVWVIDGVSAGMPPVITYGANSRQVTITGLVAGTYKLGATTPNGKTGALVVQVQ